MYAQNSILCQFGNLEICPNFANPYLTQFSSISGGNCITSLPTGHSAGSQATANIEHTEEDATPTTPQPSRVQSTSYTPVNHNTSTQQLQVGDHIYIKNKISHSDRPNARDSAGIVTGIAHHPKKQVFLTTYLGVETWRSPLNLRRLSLDEKARLREQQDE